MDREYWLQRWREGRTGWHRTQVMPLLEKHLPALGLPDCTRVLVPLCGKTLDMLWLSGQKLEVLGVDVSPIAIETFLADNHLHARTRTLASATHYLVSNAPDGGDIELVNGDVFELDDATLAACGAFYDRGALIALPPALRERLAHVVYARLPPGAKGLMITLEYPQDQMDGPPFSVPEAEVHRLLDAHWDVQRLERRDILASQPHFAEAGIQSLHTCVYAMTRRTG